jgi:hypothetical protein
MIASHVDATEALEAEVLKLRTASLDVSGLKSPPETESARLAAETVNSSLEKEIQRLHAALEEEQARQVATKKQAEGVDSGPEGVDSGSKGVDSGSNGVTSCGVQATVEAFEEETGSLAEEKEAHRYTGAFTSYIL